MLFSDLSIGETVLWQGVPCLNSIPLDSFSYLGFSGHLLFSDMMGIDDPRWEEFGDRFILLYMNGTPAENVQVPLEKTPNQRLNIILGGQNCTLSIYYKEINPDLLLSNYVTIQAPASGLVTDILTATAAPVMASYLWSVTNATILSGQGTSSITYQALSVAPVVITLNAVLPQGGATSDTATTIIYDSSAFAITAPEYVWAGQFGIVASVPFSGSNFKWVPSGAVRLIGQDNTSAAILDAGMASQAASISATVSNVVMSTWYFKIVPYTSSMAFGAVSLLPDAVQTFVLDLGWAYEINSVAVDSMCWVRIYNTQADLDADAGRAIGDDPTTAIVWDGIFTAAGIIYVDPRTSGVNGDSPRTKAAYVSVKNTDVGSRNISVNITRTETQVSNVF